MTARHAVVRMSGMLEPVEPKRVDHPLQSDGTPAPRGRSLLSQWWWRVTAAELAGFAVPAVVGAATAGSPSAIAVPALLAAGSIEGAMLGWGQASVLVRAVGVDRRRWVTATSIGAVLAYLAGLAPSAVGPAMESWPPAAVALAAAVVGIALLLTIGTAQWLVLRCYLPRSGRWIPFTALAWLIGLAVFLAFTMPLWQPGQSPATVIGIGLAGGALMAAITSLITGAALLLLIAEADRERSGL